MNFVPLPQTFYKPSAKVVASRLLGHWLLRRTEDGWSGGPIVETEAYLVGDPASHGFIGETDRTRIMYGPPGFAYVYFIYGTHYCVNAVCNKVGRAEAVLIRAIEPAFDQAWMLKNRAVEISTHLTNGPGKLCAALDVQRNLTGASLFQIDSPLIIARNPEVKKFRRGMGPVVITPRIGINKAADLELRFYLTGSPFISRRLRLPAKQSTAPSA